MLASRRDFLKGAAALSALSLLPPSLRVLASPLSNDSLDAVTAFLTAMERPYAAPVNLPFERIIGNKTIGLLLYDVNNARLMTALNPEKLFPVASAFKAPLLMYFLDQIDPDVWNIVPVEAWSAATTADVPEDAHDAWRQHNGILRALWQMIVFSDNPTTGAVLAYVAEANGRTDAIVAFNDWLAETVGVSQLSGVSAWGQGVVGNFTVTDERFKDSGTTINGQVVTLENLMTPRDLGLPYMWMLSEMSEDGRRVCMELLSVIHNGRGANLERLATENDGTPYSKNGSLGTEAGYVVADAGLIDLPDDRRYLLVFLSLNAAETVQTVFEELNLTLRGKHNELLHNRHVVGITDEELTASYREHLAAAYPQGEDATPGLYRYGFVIPAGVTVYRTPDEDNALHNPIIKSTRFGIHLLMQGALVRYVEVDDEWVELMPDNDFDNVRSRLGIQVFLKREDVWPISLDYAAPIPYLVEPDIVHEDKFVVIHLAERELFAFEGETPVMRVPIVLNPDATPRGAQVITSKWFARSMQPWAPGVPFTSFFGSQGFALHGSPWQRWSTTVNKETIYGRSSAGCVNVPDWSVTCGGYTRPADELLFRWIGGIENPQEAVFEYPSETYPALRIYTGDYLHNLRNFSRPAAMVNRGLSWDDVIERMEGIPLQAPDSFFV